MINKTKNLEIFKFRDDNREKIRRSDVDALKERIKKRNMLDIFPIIVNKDMEIIQGQHRVLAAKDLGLEIFYQVFDDFKPIDIVTMNSAKAWTNGDILNFYCKNGYPHYLALKDFMTRNNLNLRTALLLTIGESKESMRKFKDGEYIFVQDASDDDLLLCWQTIDLIKKLGGNSSWTENARFWKAMLRLFRSPTFDSKKWTSNCNKLVSRFAPKGRSDDYCAMVEGIYNYGNQNKIYITRNAEV